MAAKDGVDARRRGNDGTPIVATTEPLPHLSAAEESFLRTKYGFDRELELELNRGAAAYEQEVLRTLVLLNGGAAAAFLGLYGALAETGAAAPPALVPTLMALVAWGGGLLAAGTASVQGLWAQQRFAQARRLKRQALERLFRYGCEDRRATERAHLEQRGERVFTDAKHALERSKRLAYGALIAFALGLAAASFAVIVPAPP
ncbi:MAG: hypothetical protein AAF371_10105 [Pseudomonadota bacterium]